MSYTSFKDLELVRMYLEAIGENKTLKGFTARLLIDSEITSKGDILPDIEQMF